MQDIKGFEGEYRFLSNFWPCTVQLGGLTFKSTEAAYQAAKTLSYEEREAFTTLTPSQSKAMGRQITLRYDWDTVKDDIMEDLLRQKFSTDPLRAKLLATGDCYIEETNYWNDTYWGVCKGVGKNMLGKLLMKIRAELSGNGGGPKARGSEGPSSANAIVTTTAVSPETSTTGAEGPVLIAATGHRPDKLFSSYPYSDESFNRLVLFVRQVVIPGIRRKFSNRDIVLMSGMAVGWDQAIAQAAIHENIPFEVAIPFKGQELIWPHKSQVRYQSIIVHARKIHLLSDTPDQSQVGRLLNERNHFMVDWCDYLVALWDGSAGGTGNCIRYAETKSKKAINCWKLWSK